MTSKRTQVTRRTKFENANDDGSVRVYDEGPRNDSTIWVVLLIILIAIIGFFLLTNGYFRGDNRSVNVENSVPQQKEESRTEIKTNTPSTPVVTQEESTPSPTVDVNVTP